MSEDVRPRVERVLEAIRAGGMVIVTDDADRENEGDLIMAAEKATPEQIAFIVRHTSGILCVPLEADLARRLNLAPMVNANDAPLSTAFTVSVDARAGLTTGISARERCTTVLALADPHARAEDFVRPGHVFPLISRDGGVLMRSGHTEAATDLARLADCRPVGLIAELVNDDGSVKKGEDIDAFAREHDLPMVSINDLIAYRQGREVLIERMEESGIETCAGPAHAIVYSSRIDQAQHVVLRYGDRWRTDDVLVRFQLENVVEDVFGGADGAVTAAMRRLAAAESGVLVYLRLGAAGVSARGDASGGRDAETHGSAQDRASQWKDIGLGAQILRDLGVRSIRLLSSTERQYVGLEGFGLEIVATEPI